MVISGYRKLACVQRNKALRPAISVIRGGGELAGIESTSQREIADHRHQVIEIRRIDRNVLFRFRHRGCWRNRWSYRVWRSREDSRGGRNSFANRASPSNASNCGTLIRNHGLEYLRGIDRWLILSKCRYGQTCDNQ